MLSTIGFGVIDEETLELLTEREAMLASVEGVTKAERIGEWLWVWFEGKPSDEIREKLKAHGFTWAKKKSAWTWHNPEHKIGKHRAKSLDEIKSKYETTKVI